MGSPAKVALVVDDEVDLCEILQFDLEDEGYKTLIAHNAEQALTAKAQNSIDIIISDIRMPGGDGVYLLDQIRKQHPRNPPVIFVSGFADITLEEAFHKGVNGLFSKPIETTELLDHLKFCLLPAQERWKPHTNWQDLPDIRQTFDSWQSFSSHLGNGGFFLPQNLNNLTDSQNTIHFTIDFKSGEDAFEGIAVDRWQRFQSRQDQSPTLPGASGCGLEFLEMTPSSIERLEATLKAEPRIPFIPMHA